jgi:cytochrome c
MKTLIKLALPVAMLVSAPAFADQALATKNGCTACHAADKKLVGPAFQDIAKKYAGDAGAVDKMAAKIKAGGKGAWGPVPMPAHPQISDADLRTLAAWALKGGPAK